MSNEQLYAESGDISGAPLPPVIGGSGSGFSGGGVGVGAGISPGSGTNAGTSQNPDGWIEVDYSWKNPTAFNALAGVDYIFCEGIIPINYR